MSRRKKTRRSGMSHLLGGTLFGGSRRTARAFVSVVALVFSLVCVLVLQTWQRVEIIETMNENEVLARDMARLRDLVVCHETALERRMSRAAIIERAGAELGLRFPLWSEVLFVRAAPVGTGDGCPVALAAHEGGSP